MRPRHFQTIHLLLRQGVQSKNALYGLRSYLGLGQGFSASCVVNIKLQAYE